MGEGGGTPRQHEGGGHGAREPDPQRRGGQGAEPERRLEQSAARAGQVRAGGQEAGRGRGDQDDGVVEVIGRIDRRREGATHCAGHARGHELCRQQARPTGEQRDHQHGHRRDRRQRPEDLPHRLEAIGEAGEEIEDGLLELRRRAGGRRRDREQHPRDHEASDVAGSSARAALVDDPEDGRRPAPADDRSGRDRLEVRHETSTQLSAGSRRVRSSTAYAMMIASGKNKRLRRK